MAVGIVCLSRSRLTTRDWNNRNTFVDWAIFSTSPSRDVTIPNKIVLSDIGSPYASPKAVFKDGASSSATRGIIGQGFSRVDLDATGHLTNELFIISDTPYKPFSESGRVVHVNSTLWRLLSIIVTPVTAAKMMVDASAYGTYVARYS